MKRFLRHCRLPQNVEVLFMLTLGIILQTTDGSPFSIKKRWMTVWETELPPEHFSQFVQHCIKMILSCIVVVRCSTTYIYVMSAMLVMFSIIKDSFPRLMLIWLFVGSVKSVFLTFIEALTGVYICSAFGNVRKACLEFFISKALELIFAAYLWGSVLKIYQEIIRKESNKNKKKNPLESRPRARSLLDESTLQKTARLNSFEFKDVPQIILQMLRREEEMSRDSLLGSGMMLASVSNFGSFEDLKTSQSLGELGLLDLKAITVMGIEEDDPLTPQERALKFLKMTWNDVRKAQETKTPLEKDIFLIGNDIWDNITGSHPFLKKPKQTRPEVVLQQISRPDSEPGIQLIQKESRKNSFELKFGFSLFSFIREKDELHSRDEEQLSCVETLEDDGDEEDEEDAASSPLFMSNIRDEVAVNRIRLDFVSKKYKGNAYAKLYKEEYMSVIGPEVFDRATKLPKVVVPASSKIGVRSSVSLPAFAEFGKRSRKKINFEMETDDKEETRSPVGSVLSPDNSEDIKVLNDYQFDDLSRSESTFGEKQTKVNNDSHHFDSFHSLNEDFSIQETIIFQSESSACPTEAEKTVECGNEPLKTIDEHDEKGFECEISTKQLKIEKFAELARPEKSCERTYEPQPEKEPDKTHCTPEKALNGDDGFKKCYQKRRIKIRRIGKRGQNVQNDLISFNDDPDDDDGRDCTGNFAQNEIRLSKSQRSIKLRKSNNYLCSKEGENFGRGRYKQPGNIRRDENRQAFMVTKIQQEPFVNLVTPYYEQRLKSLNTDKTETSKQSDIEWNLWNLELGTQKEGKTWKSKVLKKAVQHKTIIENSDRPFSFFNNPQYSNFFHNLLTRNLLLTKYPKPSKVLDASNSNQILVYDNRRRFLHVLAEEYLKTDSSNCSINYDEESHFSSSDTMFINSPVSSSSKPFSAPDKIRTEPSESRVERKWLNAAFTGTEFGGCSQTVSDLKIQKEQIPDSVGRLAPSPGCIGVPVALEEDPEPCGRESEESFSLYYSKAADLASPLLDMKRFIYPDHIHYSYKHVKKKGFDVNINGGLPLLVRESLTMNNPIGMRHQATASQDTDQEIVRRPMDLSFASTNSWQNTNIRESGWKFETQEIDDDQRGHCNKKGEKKLFDSIKEKKYKKSKKIKMENSHNEKIWKSGKNKGQQKTFNEILKFSERDTALVEKLLKVYKKLNNKKSNTQPETVDTSGDDRPPVQISSTQLHSNKGKLITSTYNPALVLNENKTRLEKRKFETQEERTKVMFARLEREILFQSKNHRPSKTS